MLVSVLEGFDGVSTPAVAAQHLKRLRSRLRNVEAKVCALLLYAVPTDLGSEDMRARTGTGPSTPVGGRLRRRRCRVQTLTSTVTCQSAARYRDAQVAITSKRTRCGCRVPERNTVAPMPSRVAASARTLTCRAVFSDLR
jgi:hypothetical protein